MNTVKSAELFEKAKTYFPGGVNSPVRAFKSVSGIPHFIEKGDGCRIWDVDGNEFIDFCCSWGPLILGHNNTKVREKVVETINNGTSFGAPTILENELAELILNNNRFIDKIRFVSSGTEATMSAIRLARGYTNRNKIIKFDGCYHGHSDGLLVKAGSGLATFGTSSSAGVPEAYAEQTIVLPLNDKEALKKAFENYKNDIACIIMEPIPANNGLLLQDQEYLQYIREICSQEGTLLIFDEVISGFRVGFEGAAGLYNIDPDIITYGKVIGGGLPVGAYGAKAEIMKEVSPEGPVYQAGTLSGNPVAMAAGIATLTELLKDDYYTVQEEKTKYLVNAVNKYSSEQGYEFHLYSVGSIFWMAFTTAEKVQSADAIDIRKMDLFKAMYSIFLDNGIYFGPSGYEVGFISQAHGYEELDRTIEVFKLALKQVFETIEA